MEGLDLFTALLTTPKADRVFLIEVDPYRPVAYAGASPHREDALLSATIRKAKETGARPAALLAPASNVGLETTCPTGGGAFKLGPWIADRVEIAIVGISLHLVECAPRG